MNKIFLHIQPAVGICAMHSLEIVSIHVVITQPNLYSNSQYKYTLAVNFFYVQNSFSLPKSSCIAAAAAPNISNLFLYMMRICAYISSKKKEYIFILIFKYLSMTAHSPRGHIYDVYICMHIHWVIHWSQNTSGECRLRTIKLCCLLRRQK